MNPIFIPVNNIISARLPDVTSRGRVLAAAIGLALSRVQPLPSAPVEDHANYYNLNVLQTVKDQVSAINENIIIDINDTLQWARSFWTIRYHSAHPKAYIFAGVESKGFFESLVGGDTLVAPQQREMLDANRTVIFELAVDLCSVFKGE